jgi:hypothetical protein
VKHTYRLGICLLSITVQLLPDSGCYVVMTKSSRLRLCENRTEHEHSGKEDHGSRTRVVMPEDR